MKPKIKGGGSIGQRKRVVTGRISVGVLESVLEGLVEIGVAFLHFSGRSKKYSAVTARNSSLPMAA